MPRMLFDTRWWLKYSKRMKKRKILLSSWFICCTLITFAQERKCAVKPLDTKSQFRNTKLDEAVKRVLEHSNRNSRTVTEIITIPIVVHVIHNTASGEIGGPENGNISNEQIFSQIKVLNNDFRRKVNTPGFNNHPAGADLELNFELARFTPDGLPSSGIVRVFNNRTDYDVFNDNELLSSLSYWDADRYLNIWVTTLQDNYIGYAEFPTGDFNGLDFDETNPRTDGLIIDHEVFGNQTGTARNGIYTYGRTVTHEVGHWFGLIHTWGDAFCGTDYCDDTPTVRGANNTITCEARPSRCDGVSRIPMIENYMDYTPDSCMHIFTMDQKNRVQAILEISQRRNRLIKAAKLNFIPVEQPELSILNNPGSNADVQIKVQLPDFQDFEINMFTSRGQLIYSNKFLDSPGLLSPISEFTKQKGLMLVQLSTRDFVTTKKVMLL